jgi:hypothetical protein
MFNLLVGSFGFRTSFTLTFERILPPRIDGAPPVTVELPTIVPVSREFFDGEVTVEMTRDTGASFTAVIHGLGDDVFALLDPQKTLVHITLGYADGTEHEVVTGVLQKKSQEAGDGFYDVTLTGIDHIFDRLQCPKKRINYESKTNKSIGDIAKEICQLANVPAEITKTITLPELKPISFHDVTPLMLLQELTKRAQDPEAPDDIQLQVKDGTVWIDSPSHIGKDHPTPVTDVGDDTSLTTSGDCAAENPPDGRDFTIAGDPTLRPNDTINLNGTRYRIERIAHTLSADAGYTCSGRVLIPEATAADQKKAGRPDAAMVAKIIQDNTIAREQRRPAVSAGEVDDYTAGQHTTTVKVGTAPRPEMTNRTVEAPLARTPVALPDKPMASAFAFDKCGLMVPVYPKMRALLVHGWNDPNDAVIDGFLWTSQMTPPPNQAGDWWLCLPTEFTDEGLPTGPTTDDLITKDGQRLISVKGLKITVGAGLQNSAGSRPTPGSDESLTVEAAQGAKITLKTAEGAEVSLNGAQIQLTDGAVTVTIGNGKVSIG